MIGASELELARRERLRPRLWQWDYLGMAPLLREVRSFAGAVAHESGQRVLDLGCGAKPYEPLFSFTKAFVGFDVEPNPRVDVVGVTWDLPFAQASFDAVVATQVLEHTARVSETVQEIYRVLRPGGLVLISVPLTFPEHGAPHDYYRFTQYGLRHLFTDFEIISIVPLNGYVSTLVRLFNWFIKGPRGRGRWWAPVYGFTNCVAMMCDWLAFRIAAAGGDRAQWWYRHWYQSLTESYVLIARRP